MSLSTITCPSMQHTAMAGTSDGFDSSLRFEVDRSVSRIQQFSEGERSDGFTFAELPSFSALISQQAQLETYEEKVALLEEEVEMLEKENEDIGTADEVDNEELDNIMKKLLKAGHIRKQNDEDVQKESIADLEEKLDVLAKFSGIELLDTSSVATAISESHNEFCHVVRGRCQHVTFTLNFTIVESKETAGECSSRVTVLKIDVDENVGSELKETIQKIEDQRSIHKFFMLIVPYAEWSSSRQKAFSYYKENFPQLVSLPFGSTGPYLKLSMPSLLGCVLTIQWQLVVQEECKVLPSLDLFIKIPKDAFDSSGVELLQSMPSQFRKLLRLTGVKQSIDMVIRLASAA